MKPLKKEQLLELLAKRDRENAALRKENREISSSLSAVLKTRSSMKDEVADLVADEIDALSSRIEDYQAFGTPEEIAAERDAMLRALNMDEFEWRRRKWKFL